MGSDKKRKRVSADTADVPTDLADKLERKRLKKEKKNKTENGGDDREACETVTPLVSPIATPMAGRKLSKKLLKLVGHAAKGKALRRGIKEVVLSLRKKDSGIVVLAGDVFPIEVIAHIPVMCEEADIPYCYVPTKAELGASGHTKRPTSVVLVSSSRAQDDVKKEIEALRVDVKAIQNLY